MKEYPHWIELVESRYNDRFVLIFQKLQNQLADLLGECLSTDFYNEYLDVLRNQSIVNPVSGLWKSIERTYGFQVRAIDFPRKNKEISQTINELRHILINVSFMISTQDIFDEVNKLPIYCN